MKKNTPISTNEVSELCVFSLGGFPQKVLIEGKRKNSPIVITLHGGPGTPIPFSVGCRGLFPAFTNEFLMVYWDQLGCGSNNHIIDDTFSIDSFVCMTEELVAQIKAKFPQNKIMIFSTSWGSILSARLLERNPHAVDGVVACGQIIKNVFFCEEVNEALAQTNISKKKLEKIKNVTADNFTEKDLQFISGALRKYTDAYQNKKGKMASMGAMIKGLLTSPDYTGKDVKAILMNGYRGNTSLWKEIIHINLSEALKKVQVPYMMLQGDTDIIASTRTAEELANSSSNAYLTCKVVADTGHFPGVLMMDMVWKALKETSTQFF